MSTCPSCGGVDTWHHDLTDCLKRLKAQLAERERRIVELEAAARQVVKADTIKTPGVGRLEGIQRALLDLEALLPEPTARCGAALPQRPQDGDVSSGGGCP